MNDHETVRAARDVIARRGYRFPGLADMLAAVEQAIVDETPGCRTCGADLCQPPAPDGLCYSCRRGERLHR